MQTSLQRDHASVDPGLQAVDVQVKRLTATAAALRYVVAGAIDQIVVPPPGAPERSHGLWESTCFEAFLRKRDGSYLEFNFSPSGEWAAYHFSDYRTGMAEAPLPEPPHIRVAHSPEQLRVDVVVQLPSGTDVIAMNLAAVILSRAGERSFWAAKHPEGEPDFHDPDCFIHQLPAAPAS